MKIDTVKLALSAAIVMLTAGAAQAQDGSQMFPKDGGPWKPGTQWTYKVCKYVEYQTTNAGSMSNKVYRVVAYNADGSQVTADATSEVVTQKQALLIEACGDYCQSNNPRAPGYKPNDPKNPGHQMCNPKGYAIMGMDAKGGWTGIRYPASPSN